MNRNKTWTIISLLLIFFSIFGPSGCTTDGVKSNDDKELDRKIDSVLSLMTLEEKLGQLTLYTSNWDVTGPVMREDYIEEIRAGRCGNIFNAHTVDYNRGLQKIAIEESRLGIPLLFGYDVIHGHKTIFPVPLAEACSWNLDLLEKTARFATMEATASGLNWTFAPMVDISRDPRWGRISEGNGEDVYLGARITEARVRGIQGDDLSDSTTMAACIKHFAGYGAPVAGREYNTVDMSELEFRQFYLPTYEAGIKAGAVTVMASFNDIFAVPAHASKFLLREILQDEWGLDGFVVADYSGVEQNIDHGVAADRLEAGTVALNAGLHMDMQSGIYSEVLAEAVEKGLVKIEDIDDAVNRILRVKFQLGLFEDPYRYLDNKREKEVLYAPEIMEHALVSAMESVVLLKNENYKGNPVLPLNSPGKIAVIGPMADSHLDMLGSWHGAGDASKAVSVLDGIKNRFKGSTIKYLEGCDFGSEDRSGFRAAVSLAKASDVVILAIGEREGLSGEAASRSDISIPGVQEELALELLKTGKPVVILLMGERMLTFPELDKQAGTLLYAWHLGTRGGDAIANILAGDFNPSAKLVMSIPRNVGQIPVYYNHKNTGRPKNDKNKFTSKYLDVENTPLYPFGFGISYTKFEYSNPSLNTTYLTMGEALEITVEVKNTGNYDGTEIVQLYIRDLVGSVTRPVKELKGFQKVFIRKGERAEVTFTLSSEDLKFYNSQFEYVVEPGEFNVFVGPNSATDNKISFTLNN